MKHPRFLLLAATVLFPVLVSSCKGTSGPDPDDVDSGNERDQLVTFTLTKLVAYGDCDGWRCEATSSSDSDFRGTVYLQVADQPKTEFYKVNWDGAKGTKTLTGQTTTLTVTHGQWITISSGGLKDYDSVSGDEGLSQFSKEFHHPIKNYTDLAFDCLHNNDGCYCCLTFHWDIKAEYVN